MPATHDAFDELPLPETSPRGMLRHFGPGLILMMTGVGTSHLVTAPAAGGRFEFALLWCIPVAYIFQVLRFRDGVSLHERHRQEHARCVHDRARQVAGVVRADHDAHPVRPGSGGPAGGGRRGALLRLLRVSRSGSRQLVYGLGLGGLSVGIILYGRYAVVELSTKILAGLLFVSTLGVYLVEPAPLSAMGHFFTVEVPGGSWLIIAAFLGLLPTGMDVSLQASEWGKAKRVGMGRIREQLEQEGYARRFDPFAPTKADLSVDVSTLPEHAREYCRRWFRIGLWDFSLGHVVSFVLAAVFLLLAAVWLYPSPVEGTGVIGEIAGIFTESVGPSMMFVFLAGAFAATFSTVFNYFDGWPRVVAACCRNLFRTTAALPGIAADRLTGAHRGAWSSEYNVYRITMFYSLAAAVLIIAGLPRPVFLVLVSSALAFFISPVIFFLNLYYCLTVIPKTDRVFYPSRFATWFSWLSLVIFTGLTVVLIMARVFDVTLFGG